MNRDGFLRPPSKRKGTVNPLCLSKQARTAGLRASERECALKQSYCLQALQAYFMEARNTVELIRQHCREPTSIAKHLQVIAQRDREAQAQREYLQARKLLLHTAKISSLPSKRAGGQ